MDSNGHECEYVDWINVSQDKGSVAGFFVYCNEACSYVKCWDFIVYLSKY